MPRLPSIRARRRQQRIDRLTIGLAASAVVTSGAVIAGEFSRRYRGRLAERHPSSVLPDSPVEALELAGRATQDTILVAVEGYTAASRRETVLFNLFSGFVGAFAWARISTAGIRAGWWPLGNVNVGGRHIHHYVPGIGLAFASGAAAILSESSELETFLAVPFGVGAGLTFDEAALLLDLRDVYWQREGRLSIQVSAATASVLAATILGMRLLRRGERRGEDAGLIPPVPPAFAASRLGRGSARTAPTPRAGATPARGSCRARARPAADPGRRRRRSSGCG